MPKQVIGDATALGARTLTVHLDNTKLVDGLPDPAYVVAYTFPALPAGLDANTYASNCLAEMQRLADIALAQITSSTASIPGGFIGLTF